MEKSKHIKLRIAIIYGSVRQKRKGIKAARYLLNKSIERGNEAELIDPAVYPLPFLDMSTQEYSDKTEMPGELQTLSEIFEKADAFILVTGEYNHSVPPALKNLLDHFLREFAYKPCGIACYSKGMFGGIRAAEHLRNIMCELASPSIRSLFVVPQIQHAFDDEGNALDAIYDKKSRRFFDELEWYATALKEARLKGMPGK